ncbi:hypothetical protein [uncultured Victivallis sp.]|uniref:hypothetical protein n=1 Tax=uncultured Victivallis sp. TaxID=354118 RepID=UPI0025E2CD33|nr:hypothetical protein [uncultured Victivallis sp.]
MKQSRWNRILPGVAAALALFTGLDAADLEVPAEITGVVPEAGEFKLLYRYDLMSGTGFGDNSQVKYLTDNSSELSKNAVVKVAYFMDLAGKDGNRQWVYVSMDSFDPNAVRLGVPTAATGSDFQQMVTNLEVRSNVPGLKTGSFEFGNIEFWPTNYGGENAIQVSGASDQKFDFGDVNNKVGNHGSMQVHNWREKQTIFAYSNFIAGRNSAFGIGNNPDPAGHPDWTFCKSGPNYDSATLYVLVQSGTPLESPLLITPPRTLEQVQADATNMVPETGGMELLYLHNLKNQVTAEEVPYLINNAEKFAGRTIKRVGYLAALTGQDGSVNWVYAEMDSFSPDASKLGVPNRSANATFQQNVENLVVKSNTDRVSAGSFPQGNIEFWAYNYNQKNSASVPGASDTKYDHGDTCDTNTYGYGSMQIHNFSVPETVFAYNNFRAKGNSDVGIGNNPDPKGQPDWTFSGAASALREAYLYVFVTAE